MTFDSNTSTPGSRLPLAPSMVDLGAVKSAANDGAFVLVPEFCVTAPVLREAVDLMADLAMTGKERIKQVIANAPAEMQPLLNDLSAIFGLIGHKADSTSDDIGADMSEVWGVAAA